MQTREEYNAYHNQYMKARYHRRRAEAIVQLGGVCIDCGTSDEIEFDHDDATSKNYDIGKIFSSGSEAKVQAELSKCVLRCNDCHKKKSVRSNDWRIVEHGSGVSGKKNCPCSPCKKRKAEYMKNYKAMPR